MVEDSGSSMSEAATRAHAQKLFDESVTLFTSLAMDAVDMGGSLDSPLVQAAQVEMSRVKEIVERLGRETVAMPDFQRSVTQILEATERLAQDMKR